MYDTQVILFQSHLPSTDAEDLSDFNNSTVAGCHQQKGEEMKSTTTASSRKFKRKKLTFNSMMPTAKPERSLVTLPTAGWLTGKKMCARTPNLNIIVYVKTGYVYVLTKAQRNEKEWMELNRENVYLTDT